MLYITKKMEFSAAHRLHNPELSDEQNNAVFKNCNNLYGHGHNYTLEVTVRGKVQPETGYLIDLKELKDIIQSKIIEKVDHKHLNHDVDFLIGIIPSVENLAVVFWGILDGSFKNAELYKIKIFESDRSFVEYYGDTAEVKIFDN